MDEQDEEHPEGPGPEEPVTERVRIVGAETASVLAGGQAGPEAATANGQTGPDEEREQRYLGFVHDVSPPPPPPEPFIPPADGSDLAAVSPELPHWSDPPTGQVPAIIDRRADEPEDPFADSGPVWREHDHEWQDTGFDAALLRDEGDEPSGALDETTRQERRPWEFDDLAPAGSAPAPSGPTAVEQGTLDWDDVVAGEAAELDTGKIDTGAIAGAGELSADEPPRTPHAPFAADTAEEESITGQHRAVVSSWWDDQGRETETGGAADGPPADDATSVLPTDEPTRVATPPSLAGDAGAAARAEDAPFEEARAGDAFFDEPSLDEVEAPAGEDGGARPAGSGPVGSRPVVIPRDRHRTPAGPARGAATDAGPQPRNVPAAIATGVGIAALALLCFWAGTVPTLVLATVVVTLAAAEAYAALRRSGRRPATLLGLVATVAVMVTAYTRGVAALPLVTMLVVVTAMVWYLVGADRSSATEGVSSTVLGFMWVGVLGSFSALMLAPSIYPHRHGVAFLLGAVVATVAEDVGALAVGSLIGRHQLAPHVSPNKTWEGWVGGAVLAVAASILITGQVHPWTPAKAAILGAVIAVVGPVGDLCESLVKRDLGLKDMGSLLPGHGGVLDRVDALLFALPATYYLVRLLNLG